jgi:D-glycero-D-manno-heptose 1,7-bisphosphate phosphatase
MSRAVFLDREGVITELVLNPRTGEYEPPHDPLDLKIYPEVIETLRVIQSAGFELFLISNQPDYAKGKTSLKNLQSVHLKLDEILIDMGIYFRQYFYCYHHPHGIIPSHSYDCECRKPKPFFLFYASRQYDINLNQSWMIGDRNSDIECGKNAGTKTILIQNPHTQKNLRDSNPDFLIRRINEIPRIII